MMKCVFGFILTLGLVHSASWAQLYPKDYFSSPMKIPLELAGNFGECRPNHFHTGLDFKTQQKENIPIYAAADGYVSRVSISHSGYGLALYINHPNGLQTVYAHLNDFEPAIREYVKIQQYAQEKWNIDIEIPAEKLPIKKGALAAYSGNTGSSMSPHLHFEIRNIASNTCLNPAHFGFSIHDRIPPTIKSIAIYNADISLYEESPMIFSVKKVGNRYEINEKTLALPFDNIRIGVSADDYMNGSHNHLGIYQMQLSADGTTHFHSRLDSIPLNQNRYMNAFADFKTFKNKGIWYQSLFVLPYNRLEVYEKDKNGMLSLSESPKEIKIQLSDIYNNVSICTLHIKNNGTHPSSKKCELRSDITEQINEDAFQFKAASAYIYDVICWKYQVSNHRSLSYDVTIMDADIPLHSFSQLSVRLKQFIPFELRSKLAFVHPVKSEKLPGANPQTGMAAKFEDGFAVASVRTLGNFYVIIDTIAPTISSKFAAKPQFKRGQKVQFHVVENQTSVIECKTFINDKWVCASRKDNTYSFVIDSSLSTGKHQLKVIAQDENKNTRTKIWEFQVI